MTDDKELRWIRELERKERKREEEYDKAFVKSFDDYLYEEIVKNIKGTQYYKESEICAIKNKIVIKDNYNNDNLKEEILETVKKENANEYKIICKYKDNIKIKKQYFDAVTYKCEALLYLIFTETTFVSMHKQGKLYARESCINLNIDGMFEIPKNKKLFLNFQKVNFDDIEINSNEKSLYKKSSNLILEEIDKQIGKQANARIKYNNLTRRATLRGIYIKKLEIKNYLIPVYEIRCYKPGFDIKFKINGNTKTIIK